MSQNYSEVEDEDEVENILTAVEPEIKIPLAIEWITNNFQVLDKDEYCSKDYPLPLYPQFNYCLLIDKKGDNVKAFVSFHDRFLCCDYEIQLDCTLLLGFKDDVKETINISKAFDGKKVGNEFLDVTLFECSQEEWENKYSETLTFMKLTGTLIFQKLFTGSFAIEEADRNLKIRNLSQNIDRRDFTIVVGTNELKVHKSILQENSSVFATMLESKNWKETREGRIEIKDFRFKHVKIAIEALYCKRYKKPLGIHEHISLYRFADKYDMEKLREAVKTSIILTPNNVCRYANLFLSKDLNELVDYCIDFLLVCAQYSLPIQNMDVLDLIIQNRFFERVFISPVLKKNVELENTNDNGFDKYISD